MTPTLIDIQSENIVSYKDYFDCSSSITNLDKDNNDFLSKLMFHYKENKVSCFYLMGDVGTLILTKPHQETMLTNTETIGFFNDNYEIIIRQPKFKTITRKVVIKAVSKFKPKIVL
jgi:CRISPR/Cas system endoribonuclease Cas6 (RAMP superfamily)